VPARLLTTATTLTIAAALALGTAAAPAGATSGLDAFTTPSKGIACMYIHIPDEAASLRCDVDDVVRPAKRPTSCGLDYGSAFGLTRTGRARRLCVGDTVKDPEAKVLRYGVKRTFGPFACIARTTGLRCTTRAGHGFELSRQRQKLF
jgi:uncharacterized protein DUF6636